MDSQGNPAVVTRVDLPKDSRTDNSLKGTRQREKARREKYQMGYNKWVKESKRGTEKRGE